MPQNETLIDSSLSVAANGPPSIGEIFGRALLAAGAGGAIYALWGIVQHGLYLSLGLPLWILAAGVTTLPIALGSTLVGSGVLLAKGGLRFPISVVASVASVVGSLFAFELYMSELLPAVNWMSGGLLPASSSALGFMLGMTRWPARVL